MGLITTDFRVKLAKDLQAATDVWGVIGRTAAWPDENNPPAEVAGTTAVDTPIGYKKILTRHLVKPDAGGSLQFRNQNYSIVSAVDAYDQDIVRVYLEFSFDFDEVPLDSFRQVGIQRELVPAGGFESALVLLPSQVDDPGALVYYDNRLKEDRFIDKKNVIRRIILF